MAQAYLYFYTYNTMINVGGQVLEVVYFLSRRKAIYSVVDINLLPLAHFLNLFQTFVAVQTLSLPRSQNE